MSVLSANKKYLSTLIIGIAFLATAVGLQTLGRQGQEVNSELQKFPIQAFISNGHHEFAWTLIAINGLAATVNAWSHFRNQNLDSTIRQNSIEKFEESLEALPGLAKASLGMREIFLFPSSFLAFELNDIDKAVAIAREGAKDPRLEVDLALSIAYLSHLFKGDLNVAARDYERLLVHYPDVVWLKDLVLSLKAGIDPFKRPGRSRTVVCKLMARAFPLAKRTLVERGNCTLEQIKDENTK